MEKKFDAIIIGSGQGGTPIAKKLAREGWKTALIERNHVGGTCVNIGCTPTKTMIASAKAAFNAANAKKWGVTVNGYEVNLPAIIELKNKIVEGSRSGLKEGLEKEENLTLIFGKASFLAEKKLSVALANGTTETLQADYIFIDTGTRPLIPEIDGLEEAGYLTSTALIEQTSLPEHLLIIGGNYIGLEFGQMYRRFGSQVTIVDHNERLLIREDEDIAKEVVKFLEEEDIKLVVKAQTQSIKKQIMDWK